MPAYWLGAFFNPRGLLALLKQESMKQFSADRSGNFEQFTFQTEVTSRDKDHVSVHRGWVALCDASSEGGWMDEVLVSSQNLIWVKSD